MAYYGHILDQDKIWVDVHGTQHSINAMSGRHAFNAYEYLKNHAARSSMDCIQYLARVPSPNGDRAADAVDQAMDAEVERMTESPSLWIMTKPLTKALARRVEADRRTKGWEGRRVWIEPTDPNYPDPRPEHDGYELPDFKVAPRVKVSDLPEIQDGDAARTFLVTQGDYDSYAPVAVFVGNRTSAHRFAQELGRYAEQGSVEVFDDPSHEFGIRSYPAPWTELEFWTVVEFDTSRVFTNKINYRVKYGEQPLDAECQAEQLSKGTARHPARVFIKTTGPEKLYSRIASVHLDRVVATRKALKED
jgi:hypothetical protein